MQRILFSAEHYGGLPLLHSDAKIDSSLEAILIDSPVALPYSKACIYLHSMVPVTHNEVQ